MCAAVGACSTESDVQRNNDPSGGSTGSGTTGASTTGGDSNGATTGTANGGTTGTANGATTGTANGGTTGTANGATTGTVNGATTGVATGGSSGSTTGDGDDAGMPEPCMKGATAGKSVLMIGDSYLAISNRAFGTELQRLAKAAGSLGQSDMYTDKSISGTQMAGGVNSIPTQYAGEKNTDGHVKTVVMDGGGNDILIGNTACIITQAPPENQSCVTTINNAAAAAKTLLAKMAEDGVEEVVYFFYPNLPGGGILFGNKELEKKTLDFAFPIVKEVCDSAPLNCTFVDTRGLFGETPGDFQDGIHPTVPNLQKIAGKVWQTMVDNCIAQ